MGFKEDADFARFVSMGAVGTAAVGRFLRDTHGHRPIELERYAMSNKVWQTKVKRLRLPDLICLRCGRRVESRAKSKLGIVVSHSDTAGREWNAGGMRPQDLYAFARTDMRGGDPVVGRPVFFTMAALSDSAGRAKLSDPKAASEGSEVTMSWPSWVAGKNGVLTEVTDDDRIVCNWDDGTTLRYWQWRRWGEPKFVYVDAGAPLIAGETMVAGVVSPATDVDCPGGGWDVAAALSDDDTTERFAAIKAAGIGGRRDLIDTLRAIGISEEDWRIRLEALVSLSRLESDKWTSAIVEIADSDASPAEARMEAIFALSEIPSNDASMGLSSVVQDTENPEELRAAAAWGLGRGANPRPDLLLPLTVSDSQLVSLHAIVGIRSLPPELHGELVEWLDLDDVRATASVHLLARHRAVRPLLDAVRRGGKARLWALTALGDLPPDLVREEAGSEFNDDVEQLLAPMWIAQRDWLRRDDGRDGLDALDVQTVRFDPTTLDAE